MMSLTETDSLIILIDENSHNAFQKTTMNIQNIIRAAISDAQAEQINIVNDKRKLHRERSKRFVECLSIRLREACAEYDSVASLSKHHNDDRDKFGMNELLFDVTVVQYGSICSGKSRKKLTFIKKGLWAVESEFARNKREALFDFNKLVLADSENKLFVGPRNSQESDYRRVLGEAARNCAGNVYVALIPHPDQWPEKGAKDIVVWMWKSTDWEMIS